MITKVISGGQTGADQAGIYAAAQMKIPTGGTMPKGYKVINGYDEEFAKIYGLEESHSDKYPPRTIKNVIDSDGTIRFASNFNSAGERCTLKAIHMKGKPYFDVNVVNFPEHKEVVKWIKENNIKVLNIAGNSEKSSPGITSFVVNYLLIVFKLLGKE